MKITFWNGIGKNPSESPWIDDRPGVVLSLGAGVDSWAMCLLFINQIEGKKILDNVLPGKKIDASWRPDLILMADVGNERPETYQYIEDIMIPYFDKKNIPFVMVKKTGSYSSLYQDICNRGQIPFIPNGKPKNGMGHSCSQKWKKEPQESLEKRLFPKGTIQLIGYNADEKGRSKKANADIDCDYYEKVKPYGGKSKAIFRSVYPMIVLDAHRKDEEDIIKAAGYPVPVKSSCFFCPWMQPWELEEIYNDQPSIWNLIIHAEDTWRTAGMMKGWSHLGGIDRLKPLEVWSDNPWANGKRWYGRLNGKSLRELEKTFFNYNEERTHPFKPVKVPKTRKESLEIYDIPTHKVKRRALKKPVLRQAIHYDF